MSSDTLDTMSKDDEAAPEPLGKTEGVYQRDAEGELQPLPPTPVEIDGEMRSVRFYPVPIGEFEQYKELGEEMAMAELCDIMAEKVHTPDRTAEEWGDTDPTQFMAVLSELVKQAAGEVPSSEFHEEIQAELEGRDSPGN